MPVKPKQEAATLGDPLVAGSNIDTNAGHVSLFMTQVSAKPVPLPPPLAGGAPSTALTPPRLALPAPQFRTVCVKNWTLTKRDKKSLLREILIPSIFMFALYFLRMKIGDVQEPEKSGVALPLLPATKWDQPPSQINYTDDGGKTTTSYCDVGVTTELPDCAIPGARSSTSLSAAVEKVWDNPKSKVICYPNSAALNARAADAGAPCMAFGVALSTPVGLTGQAADCKNTNVGTGTPLPPKDVSDAACTIPYTIYTNYSTPNGGYQFNFTPSNALWQNNYFDGLGQDGFSWVQQTVDQILIKAAAAPRAAEVSLAAVRHAHSYIPAFLSNPSRAILQNIFPIYLTIIFSIQVRVLLVRILEEKEKKLKEGMLMVGLIKSVNVLAHISAQLIKGCVPIAVVLFFGYKCTLFEYSDASLLLFYFVVFSLDCYAFCFLISSFFSTAKTGGVAGYVLYTVLLFVGELYQTASAAGCTVIGLIAPAGFFVGNAIINSAEANNHGVTWANMGDASIAEVNGQPVAISFGGVLSLLVFDFFFYMALNSYLERVVQNEHGTTLPWHFPLHLSWWRDGSLPGDNCGGDGGVALGRLSTSGSSGGASGRPSLVEANFEEVDESDLGPLAVSITQLSKRFKAKAEGAARDAAATNDSDDDDDADLVSAESADSGGGGCFAKCTAARRRERKAAGGETWLKAVDNLTLDMYEGQITCLLGHNGAGKSTTISMLTGLYPPTSGTARLYGKNLVTQMEDVRQLIGVCPQHDVIWPLLTVAEHLRIFAAIKVLGLVLSRSSTYYRLTPLLVSLSLLYYAPAPLRRHQGREARRGRGGGGGAHRRGRPGREEGRARGLALGRHEAPPLRRHGAHRLAQGRLPRRADVRPGPAGAAPDLGAAVRQAQGARHRAHHALHGRGGPARRPHRHHVGGQAALHRLVALPKEPLRRRLPPDAGQGRVGARRRRRGAGEVGGRDRRCAPLRAVGAAADGGRGRDHHASAAGPADILPAAARPPRGQPRRAGFVVLRHVREHAGGGLPQDRGGGPPGRGEAPHRGRARR
jgi:ABC-type Fe3+/spermidine/putrescine transport system ATPase subunit